MAIDENTFYKGGKFGISRTTDAGASWHPFVKGMTGPRIYDFIALNHRLYMNIGRDLVYSTDTEQTWQRLRFNTHEQTLTLDADFYTRMKLRVANNRLYAISIAENKPSLFRTSDAGDELILLQGVPAFEAEIPPDKGGTSSYGLYLLRTKDTRISAFAVRGETFYVKYHEKLYKWKPGNTQWTDTGVGDLGVSFPVLAVSGETVYLGNQKKRHLTLFQSLDSGDSWKDITQGCRADSHILRR